MFLEGFPLKVLIAEDPLPHAWVIQIGKGKMKKEEVYYDVLPDQGKHLHQSLLHTYIHPVQA